MIDFIEEDFNKVLAHSQLGDEFENLNTSDLINNWREAKKKFIDAWGGCIYESPDVVNLEMSDNARRERLNGFITRVTEHYQLEYLSDFLYANRMFFYDNKVEVIPSFCNKNIKEGMKLIKCFKFFIEDEDTLRELQDEASVLIQEHSISGRICLSVHPLDFLSISENAHNWRSCHSLDGDYRLGNLNYMVDSVTFITYIKDEFDDNTKYILPDFPDSVKWNSKKWRCLMIADKDNSFFMFGRQYPFFSYSAMRVIKEDALYRSNLITSLTPMKEIERNIFKNEMPKPIRASIDQAIEYSTDNESLYTSLYINDPYILIQHRLFLLEDIVSNHKHMYGFNDFLLSSVYVPFYFYARYWDTSPITGKTPLIEVGGTVKCIKCGQNIVKNGETMLCPTCYSDYPHEDEDIEEDDDDEDAEDVGQWATTIDTSSIVNLFPSNQENPFFFP